MHLKKNAHLTNAYGTPALRMRRRFAVTEVVTGVRACAAIVAELANVAL